MSPDKKKKGSEKQSKKNSKKKGKKKGGKDGEKLEVEDLESQKGNTQTSLNS
jgi:hypothetical protein